VPHADRFVTAIRAEIRSEQILALPEHLYSLHLLRIHGAVI
jgi:hypothetical protein